MRRTRFLPALTVVVVALAAACGSSDPALSSGSSTPGTTGASGSSPAADDQVMPELTPELLAGTTFVSTSSVGRELVAGTQITMVFTDTNVSVAAGCNTLNGSYTLDGATMTVDADVASTMMACPEPLSDQDTWLTGWLQAGVTAAATADGISMTGDGIAVELAAEAAGSTGSPVLTGTTWTLTSIEFGDAVSSLPSGVEAPTLEFAEAGTVAVFTGCNRGSGTYEVGTDGFITFGAIAVTEMACGPDAQQVETAVTTVLAGRVAFGFGGNDVSLTSQGQTLIFAPAP